MPHACEVSASRHHDLNSRERLGRFPGLDDTQIVALHPDDAIFGSQPQHSSVLGDRQDIVGYPGIPLEAQRAAMD